MVCIQIYIPFLCYLITAITAQGPEMAQEELFKDMFGEDGRGEHHQKRQQQQEQSHNGKLNDEDVVAGMKDFMNTLTPEGQKNNQQNKNTLVNFVLYNRGIKFQKQDDSSNLQRKVKTKKISASRPSLRMLSSENSIPPDMPIVLEPQDPRFSSRKAFQEFEEPYIFNFYI